VDGCFWHGHGHQGLPTAGPNADLWKQKIRANQERDARAVELAEALGWKAIRVWECQIQRHIEEVVAQIRVMTQA